MIGPKSEVGEEFHCLDLYLLIGKGRYEGVMNLRRGPAVFNGSALEVVDNFEFEVI